MPLKSCHACRRRELDPIWAPESLIGVGARLQQQSHAVSIVMGRCSARELLERLEARCELLAQFEYAFAMTGGGRRLVTQALALLFR